jgi:hypothetical protein
VYDTSFQEYEAKYGGIQKMFALNQGLLLFQELKIGRVLVEQIIVDTGQGNSIIGVSENVLSVKVEYDTAEIGIGKNPESFAVRENSIYGVDVKRGVIWRRALDGIIPISNEGGMSVFVMTLCQKILQANGRVNIYGVFDVRFGEYVVAFSAFTMGAMSPVVVASQTLAWNESTNQFSTFYSYAPENMCSKGIDMVSFENGGLWVHDSNPLQANFYGVQYYPELWVVMNDQPSNEKVLEMISEETNSAWEVYEISTPNGQLSNLVVGDFTDLENLQYAPLWKDINTPNVANPLIEGDVLRDTTFLAKFRYTLTSFTRIFCVNFKYILSNLSNR